MNPRKQPRLPHAATDLMQRAVGALQRGDLDAAAPLFRELNHRWPAIPDAWHFHGLLRHRQGADEEALRLLERAERLAPAYAPFLLNHAHVLIELGQREPALRRLRKALALHPADETVLVAIAHLWLGSGRGASFVNELERHRERAPRAWRPWMLLAQCREQAGASAEALGAFEKAAKLAPAREIAPLVLLGEAARRNARPDLAQEAFTRALERDPTAARALLGLGHLAQQRGDFADAERRFRAALALEPDMYGA